MPKSEIVYRESGWVYSYPTIRSSGICKCEWKEKQTHTNKLIAKEEGRGQRLQHNFTQRVIRFLDRPIQRA